MGLNNFEVAPDAGAEFDPYTVLSSLIHFSPISPEVGATKAFIKK
jgi:hypothetical protein